MTTSSICRRLTKFLVPLLLLALTGCATFEQHYTRTEPGKLKGKLLVQWIEPDEFIFTPDKENPLTFTRSNGKTITPGRMYTDGGSIPRPLWILRSYSPWGYAPAFIVHDWLFEMKHCELEEHQLYTHTEAANVMSEVMKTMMTNGAVPIDKPTLWSMHTAVSSGIAKELWDEGVCAPPPSGLDGRQVIQEYLIEFK
ncbi:DUF1353 domain-containing protein [Pseudoxanthomonas mexicana]|uniref:DUF1353 domain-containing protein n=1 Tax=Pseudoxanthomonas mexicana TaxID=128785 RepID=UPI0024E1E43C|nr:DUF1353 domain-containing protein [Pseudoxanthomonas mexicana]